MEAIRDRSGHVVARIESHGDREVVKDDAGRVIGTMREGGTFDRNGRRLSRDRNVGLLLNGGSCEEDSR